MKAVGLKPGHILRMAMILGLCTVIGWCQSYGQRIVSESHFTMESKILSETISITTYRNVVENGEGPILYFTDGQKMIDNGALDCIKKLTESKKIPGAHYVFISTVDPHTAVDKRNTYFFCNPDYLGFFEEELIPTVEGRLSLRPNPNERSLIGISFGGLNAAYFSGKTDLFKNYGLLSPITYPCKEALAAIAFSKNKDLRIFISTGTNDAESYVGPLYQLYTSKGYTVERMQTQGAHDFKNWNRQLETLISFLIG